LNIFKDINPKKLILILSWSHSFLTMYQLLEKLMHVSKCQSQMDKKKI